MVILGWISFTLVASTADDVCKQFFSPVERNVYKPDRVGATQARDEIPQYTFGTTFGTV